MSDSHPPTDSSQATMKHTPAEPPLAEQVTEKQKLDKMEKLLLTVLPIVYREDPYDIQIENMKPKYYQRFAGMCRLALADYKETHPGKSYEFVDLEKLRSVPTEGYMHTLTFKAKHVEDETIARFKATVFQRVGRLGDEVYAVELLD